MRNIGFWIAAGVRAWLDRAGRSGLWVWLSLGVVSVLHQGYRNVWLALFAGLLTMILVPLVHAKLTGKKLVVFRDGDGVEGLSTVQSDKRPFKGKGASVGKQLFVMSVSVLTAWWLLKEVLGAVPSPIEVIGVALAGYIASAVFPMIKYLKRRHEGSYEQDE